MKKTHAVRCIVLATALALWAAPGFATELSTTARVDATGNGSTTAFTFTFSVASASHVEVFVAGVKQASGYAVTLNPIPVGGLRNPGGTVTFTAPPARDVAVRIQRAVPLTQELSLPEYSKFSSKTLEKTFDRFVQQTQQVDRRVADAEATHAADRTALEATRAGDLSLQATRDAAQDANLLGGLASIRADFKAPPATVDEQTVLAAGSTVSRKLKDRFGDVKNVLDFGADPTGATDSSSAFIATLNAAFVSSDANKNARVHLPAGTYLITQANVLNAWTAGTSYRSGAVISGDGDRATKIVFRPTAANAWMYDGQAVPNRRLMNFTVRDLWIQADGSASNSTVNLFREWGNNDGYPDQAFTLQNTRMDADANHPGVLLRVDGVFNGSENRILASRGYSWSSVLYVTNPQAVNHYVIGCDWELTRGPIFYFSAGGQLSVIGGSYILGDGSHTSDGGSLLFVDSSAGGVTGVFDFVGVRTEVYDTAASLYRLTGSNNGAIVNALGVTHRVNNTGGTMGLARVNAFSGARLVFKNSDLAGAGAGSVVFENSQGTSAWYHSFYDAGTVIAEDCNLAADPATVPTWLTNAEGGLFRVRGGRYVPGTPNGSTAAIALELDLTGPKGWTTGRNVNGVHVKSVAGFVSYWPYPSAQNNAQVQLPVGSIVNAIRVRKAGRGTDGSTYQLVVQNGDGTYTYGSSTLGLRKDQHDVMLENVNRYVGAAGVDQTIRVACTSSCGDGLTENMSPGDMFIVEYY